MRLTPDLISASLFFQCVWWRCSCYPVAHWCGKIDSFKQAQLRPISFSASSTPIQYDKPPEAAVLYEALNEVSSSGNAAVRGLHAAKQLYDESGGASGGSSSFKMPSRPSFSKGKTSKSTGDDYNEFDSGKKSSGMRAKLPSMKIGSSSKEKGMASMGYCILHNCSHSRSSVSHTHQEL